MSAPLPTQLRILESISEVPPEAWEVLLRPEDAPFLEWQWLSLLEESGSAVPRAGWHPRHLTLWRGNQLIAAAPAYLKDHSHGEFVFDWSWASAAEQAGLEYYPKLVIAVPMTPATGRRFLVHPREDAEAARKQLVHGAMEFARSEGLSSVNVLFPTEGEWNTLGELGFAQRLGVQYHWFNPGYASPDDFLARFTSKRRNQLKRERRAPASQGIAIRTLHGPSLSSIDPKAAHDVYRSTVDKFMWGRRLLTPRFFELAMERFAHRMEIVEARRGKQLVAGAINVGTPEILYGRYWGCFEELPFLHFNVCLYHSVDDSIARGRKRFEPGAGGEHKLTRGFEPSLTYSAHWIFHSRFDRAVREYVGHEARAIREGLPKWRAETGFRD